MKNSLANIPGLKKWINYFICLKYQINSKKLRIGSLNEIKNCKFGENITLGDNVNLKNSELGDFSYLGHDTNIRKTTIGKYCSIGPGCQIGLGLHPFNEFISSHPLFYSARNRVGFSILKENLFTEIKEIIIGNDVWIGAGVIILDGVKIGDGAVIAAGAVVVNDVLPFSLVAGVPAKHKKYKFDKEKIKEILENPWWEKSMKWIKINLIEVEKNNYE